MNWLSSRNYRLKLKTSGILPIILEESIWNVPQKENPKITTCIRLDLETLGYRPILPKNLPGHWSDRRGWKFTRNVGLEYVMVSGLLPVYARTTCTEILEHGKWPLPQCAKRLKRLKRHRVQYHALLIVSLVVFLCSQCKFVMIIFFVMFLHRHCYALTLISQEGSQWSLRCQRCLALQHRQYSLQSGIRRWKWFQKPLGLWHHSSPLISIIFFFGLGITCRIRYISLALVNSRVILYHQNLYVVIAMQCTRRTWRYRGKQFRVNVCVDIASFVLYWMTSWHLPRIS